MNAQSLSKILLGLNLLLVVTVVLLLLRQPLVSPAPPPIASEAVNELPAPVTPPKPRVYGSVTGADARQWIDTLREAGVPTRVLARLAREVFDDGWQNRQADAQAAYMRGDMDSDGLAALSLEHDLEQEKAIRSALGEADFQVWDKQNVLESLNLRGIQLTPTEADALYQLEKKHQQQLNELLLAKAKGQIDQATLEERQSQAQAGHEVQLKALLGEQRYAAMQGTDDQSGNLQRSLSEVTLPSEVSFESLLGLQNQWIERRSAMEGQINEAKSQIANSELELKRMDDAREREFQRVLGTNGFDNLERGQDARYQEMKRYAAMWQLDDTGTDYLYRMIKYYEKAVGDYQAKFRTQEAQGQAVDWDAVGKNVEQFAQQTEQTLRRYLGDERFNKIKSNDIFPFAPGK